MVEHTLVDSFEATGEVWVQSTEPARNLLYSDTNKPNKKHVPSNDKRLSCKLKPDANYQCNEVHSFHINQAGVVSLVLKIQTFVAKSTTGLDTGIRFPDTISC